MNTENIQHKEQYIIRSGISSKDGSMFKCITTNTAADNAINVKMIGWEKCSSIKESRMHTFEGTTLHFITDGKGYFDGISLEKGDAFMVKKNHTAEYFPDKTNPWHYTWINFDGEMSDKLMNKTGLTDNKCTFRIADPTPITNLLSEAIDEDYSKKDISMHLDSVLFEIFSFLALDKPDTFPYRSDSVREERVRRGIEYIKNNYKNKNCIDDFAKSENVDKRYISKLFREFSDRSPRSHLIRIRIEEAKNLLRTTSLSVTEIASMVGYDDVLQFSKIFRKHTGISPTGYGNGMEDILHEFE